MTAKKERIHILIADDHCVVREGLVSLVKRKPDMKVAAEASNGQGGCRPLEGTSS